MHKMYKLKINAGVMIAGKAYKKDDIYEGPLTPAEVNILVRKGNTLVEDPKEKKEKK